MAALTLASPALAATALNTYPTFLGKSGDFYVVVGANAKTIDVVGAVDIASNLAQLSYTDVTSSGAAAVNGISKDGINTGTSSTTSNNNLTAAVSGGSAFPSSGVLKHAHYAALKDSTYSWKGTDYDFREQVDVSGVTMSHDLVTDKVNGTETMVIADNNVKYQFVFEKAINLSTATTAGTTGTISSPEYSNPIRIQMMGKDFVIVGVGASSIKALQGSVGTATATTPVVYGDYSVYATQGGTSFVSVAIKDKAGNTVDTLLLTGWSTSTSVSKDSSATGLTVTVTSIAALQDGTVVGADLVVGPVGSGTHEFDGTADVSSTGTANDAFPGTTAWGIQYTPAGSPSNGYIPTNSKIEVVYKPQSITDGSIQYLKAGSALALPNSYANLGFSGFNTNDFATVTVKPWGSGSVYNSSGSQVGTGVYGFEISADKGVITSTAGNIFTKAYIVFNASKGANQFPVAVGFYDTATGHIIVNDSWAGAAVNTSDIVNEYAWGNLNGQTNSLAPVMGYAFKLNNGEYDYYLNATVTLTTNNAFTVNITAGNSAASTSIATFYQNKTAWSTSAAPQFRLGANAASGDDREVTATTAGASSLDAAKKTQDVVDDSGLILGSTSSSTGSDSVVLKVAAKNLAVAAYFGVQGAAGTTGTIKQVVPVTTAVAKLDSEIDSTTQTTKNLVLVGGPCVNTVAQALVTAGKLGSTYSCTPTLGAAWTADTSYIMVVDDAFATGKAVVLVAGTQGVDTRLATQVLQQYATKLSAITGSSVKITGTAIATATIAAV